MHSDNRPLIASPLFAITASAVDQQKRPATPNVPSVAPERPLVGVNPNHTAMLRLVDFLDTASTNGLATASQRQRRMFE